MKTPLFLGLTLALTPLAVAADPPPQPADFDANHDGKLSFEEFFKLQLKVRDPKLSEIDTNGDFKIDEAEKKAWAEEDWWAVKPIPPQTGITFDAAATTVEPPKPEAWSPKYIHLRKDHDSLLLPLDKADPASFGFFRNNLSGEDTWAVEGALGGRIPLIDLKQPPMLGNYRLQDLSFVPSVSLNRITGTGDGSLEIADALAFRAGVSLFLGSTDFQKTWWDDQVIGLSYRSLGSTEGGDFKSAGELVWQPSRGRPGEWLSLNGAYRPLGGLPIDYQLTFSGHAEFGETATTSDRFLKLGPKVGLNLQPRFLPDLTLFGQYSYFWETLNDARDFDYLETGLRWTLDANEQVFLEAKYRFGQLPAKYTDIDLFQLSLAVKF